MRKDYITVVVQLEIVLRQSQLTSAGPTQTRRDFNGLIFTLPDWQDVVPIVGIILYLQFSF